MKPKKNTKTVEIKVESIEITDNGKPNPSEVKAQRVLKARRRWQCVSEVSFICFILSVIMYLSFPCSLFKWCVLASVLTTVLSAVIYGCIDGILLGKYATSSTAYFLDNLLFGRHNALY